MRLAAPHIALALALAGCAQTDEPVSRDALPFEPAYLGIETVLLDDEIVSFRLSMTGARDEVDVANYGECAAARYALIRGYGFARHVRTKVEMQGDTWLGDAVYMISATRPEGLMTIDAVAAVATCEENGIPTI